MKAVDSTFTTEAPHRYRALGAASDTSVGVSCVRRIVLVFFFWIPADRIFSVWVRFGSRGFPFVLLERSPYSRLECHLCTFTVRIRVVMLGVNGVMVLWLSCYVC